jgi:hypothetical protein
MGRTVRPLRLTRPRPFRDNGDLQERPSTIDPDLSALGPLRFEEVGGYE